MNNTFYFLRHGKTKVDKGLPVSKWVLSDVGEGQARQRAQDGIFDEVNVIYSSSEEKAYQTAKPIADRLEKEVIQLEELCELNRDEGGFMEAEEYEKVVEYSLLNRKESVNSWETAESALQRFSQKVETLDKEYENKKILIVGHGYTINLYFAKTMGLLDKVYERLGTNSFADWGVIRDREVIQDIAK
jgi:broad specificity phosphatase PhoE